MKEIKIKHWSEIPNYFIGVVEWPDGEKRWYKEKKLHRENGPAVEYSGGDKEWYKDGKRHREDGPAVEWTSGHKEWCLEGNFYNQINLNDYVILDHDKRKYGIMWYRLLGKDGIYEHPDIPGLITK